MYSFSFTRVFPQGFLPSKVLMRHILHNGHSRGSVINVNDHIHGK